jgi:hypothetical protein
MRLPNFNNAIDQIASKLELSLSEVKTQKICQIASAISAIAAVGLVIATCVVNPSFLVALPVLAIAGVTGVFSTIAKLFQNSVSPDAFGLVGMSTSPYFNQWIIGQYDINLGSPSFGVHIDFNSRSKEFNLHFAANRG